MHEKPLKMPQNRRSARLFKILKKSQKSAIFPNLPDESSQNDHFFAYLREKNNMQKLRICPNYTLIIRVNRFLF